MSVRAAVYLRISLDATGEERAVDRQRDDALALIEARGWELHDIYVDNSISASRREKRRPDYDRMSEDFEAGLFSVIVCYNLDRLTRQPSQLEHWIEAAEKRGLRLVTLTGEADLGTDDGRLFARIKVSVARSEVERMGARRKRANAQTVAEGRPAPGRRPFGWEIDGVTIREAEAVVVRRLYARVLAGDSLRALVRELNAEGVQSPQGTPWTAFKLKQLVDRERNYGALVRYGEEQPGSLIQPIVSRQEHDRAHAIIQGRAQPGRKPERYLLSGLADCAVCGRRLGAKQLRDGSGERSPYYVCTSKLERNVASDGQIHPNMRARLLDDRVREEVVAAFLFGPADLFPGQGTDQLAELHGERNRVRESIQRLVSAVASGDLKAGQIAAQLAPLERQETALGLAIQEVEARAATGRFADIRRGILVPGKRVPLKRAAEVKAQLREAFDALPFDARRAVVGALLEIEVARGYGPKRATVTHRIVTSLNDADAA